MNRLLLVACTVIRAPPRCQWVDQGVDDAGEPGLVRVGRGRGLLGPDGLGTGLQQDDVVADDRPLDVLRAAVVALGPLGKRRHGAHLLWAERGRAAALRLD